MDFITSAAIIPKAGSESTKNTVHIE